LKKEQRVVVARDCDERTTTGATYGFQIPHLAIDAERGGIRRGESAIAEAAE
jgi:hypothetical protein